MARFRPRFSLLNALLSMTIVALAICVIQLWREVGPLRAEVRRLRDEVGVLVVDDKSKIHIIRVNIRDELAWKWRIWIPQGKAIEVHYTDDIGSKAGATASGSIATSSGSIWLREAGENVVEFRIDKDRRTDRWNGTLHATNDRVGKYEQPWVTWSATSTTSSGIGTKTESFEPGKRIELIRRVVTEGAVAGKSKPTATPSGFAIWIDPTK